MNKQEVYDQIQKLEYNLDLLRESPEENKAVIIDYTERKAKLELKLEEVAE